MVLLAREALFRICEGRLNGSIPEQQAPILISLVLDQITTIAIRDTVQAQSRTRTVSDTGEINSSLAEILNRQQDERYTLFIGRVVQSVNTMSISEQE